MANYPCSHCQPAIELAGSPFVSLRGFFFPADSGATKPTNRLLHHSAYNLNDEWLYYFKTEAKGFFLDVMMTDGYEHVLRARMHEQMVRGLLAITTERV